MADWPCAALQRATQLYIHAAGSNRLLDYIKGLPHAQIETIRAPSDEFIEASNSLIHTLLGETLLNAMQFCAMFALLGEHPAQHHHTWLTHSGNCHLHSSHFLTKTLCSQPDSIMSPHLLVLMSVDSPCHPLAAVPRACNSPRPS